MMRIALFTALLCPTLSAMAQIEGGPLTITASAWSRAVHAAVPSSRGGAPYNDLCQNAVVNVLLPDSSVTITGDNTGATDTEDFGNPVSWEAFAIDTCTTVTVSYCGTDPLFELVYSILIVGCPDFIANVQNNGTASCDDGNTVITYESLPAGTYYVPVLLAAGAEGPYTITIVSDVCDTPPLNDICANAEMLAVVQDCALGTVAGNNANAVINSAPPCAVTGSQFQDVWYQFDSGTDTSVIITLDPGSIGDIGVEVRDACAGTSVFCAVGDTAYTVPVQPGTNYRVRVFSNNDFGFGGTFGICVTSPPGTCEAGEVELVGGGTMITACTTGDPFGFTHSTPGIGQQAFVLTDELDTIVWILFGNSVNPADHPPGLYHLWGFAGEGEVTGFFPGSPLNGIGGAGCHDVSDGFVTVIIDICQGLQSTGDLDGDFTVMTTPEGPFMWWSGPGRTIDVELYDARGALLSRTSVGAHPGQVLGVTPRGAPPSGLYTLRVSGEGRSPLVKRVFVP